MDQNLIQIVELAHKYCDLCETASEYEKAGFIDNALSLLPKLYWNFLDIMPDSVSLEESEYFSTYVEEDLYNFVKNNIAAVLGEDDSYLETFMEDMKYSDTPIGATISEGMADIFQPLYDFVAVTRDSEGLQLVDSFIKCKEDFEAYWSQNLCNVMRALNNIKFGNNI